MRKLVALGAVTVALAFAATASAFVPPRAVRGLATQAAQSYWGTPPCGVPSVQLVTLPPGIGGSALIASCVIQISSGGYFAGQGYGGWYDYCLIELHEWGHLVLGDVYFAASNPLDPAHSPNPHSLMSAGVGAYRLLISQCAALRWYPRPAPRLGPRLPAPRAGQRSPIAP